MVWGGIYYQKIGNIVYVTLQPTSLLYNINAWTTISKSALPIPPSKISMKLISVESDTEYYVQLDTDRYIKNGSQPIPAGVYYSASFSYWTY